MVAKLEKIQKKEKIMGFVSIMISLLIVILIIIKVIELRLKKVGMDIDSFKDFIEAALKLDKIYEFSKKYDNLNESEKKIFLEEAKQVFDAFENTPNDLWAEEYDIYMEVLDKYNEIRKEKWLNNNFEKENRFKNLIAKKIYNENKQSKDIVAINKNCKQKIKLKNLEKIANDSGKINSKFLIIYTLISSLIILSFEKLIMIFVK